MPSRAKKRIALLVSGLLLLCGAGCYFFWYLPKCFYSENLPELTKKFPSLSQETIKTTPWFPYTAAIENFHWEITPGNSFHGAKVLLSLLPDKFYWPTKLQIHTIAIEEVPLAVFLNPEGNLLFNGTDLKFLATEILRIGSESGALASDTFNSLQLTGVMTGSFGQWQLPEAGTPYRMNFQKEGERLTLTITIGSTPRPLTMKIANLSASVDSLAVDIFGTLPDPFTRKLLHLPVETGLPKCSIRSSLHLGLTPFCLYEGKTTLNFAEGEIKLSPVTIKTSPSGLMKIERTPEGEEKIGIAALELLHPFPAKIPSMSLVIPADKTQNALLGGTIQYNIADFRLSAANNPFHNSGNNLQVSQNFSGTFNPQTAHWTLTGEPVKAESKLNFNLADHIFAAALQELSLGGTGDGLDGIAKISIKIAEASCRGEVFQMTGPAATMELETIFSPIRNDRTCRFVLPELTGNYYGQPFSVKDCKQSLQTGISDNDGSTNLKFGVEIGHLDTTGAGGSQIFENAAFTAALTFDEEHQLYRGNTKFQAGTLKVTVPEYVTETKNLSFVGEGSFAAFKQPLAQEMLKALRKLSGTIQAAEFSQSVPGNAVFSVGNLSANCDLQWSENKLSGKLENAQGSFLRGKIEKGNFTLQNWQGTAFSKDGGWNADLTAASASVTTEPIKGEAVNATIHLDFLPGNDNKQTLAQVQFGNYTLEGKTGESGQGSGGTAAVKLNWNTSASKEMLAIDLNTSLQNPGFNFPAGYLNAKELLLNWTGISTREEHISLLSPLKTSLTVTDPSGEFAGTTVQAQTVHRELDFSNPEQEQGLFSVEALKIQAANPVSTIAFKQFSLQRSGDAIQISATGDANFANGLFDFRNFSLSLPLSRSGDSTTQGQLMVDELFFGKFSLGKTAVDLTQTDHRLCFNGALKFLKDAKGILNYRGELSLPPYTPTINIQFELPTTETTDPLSLSSFLPDSTAPLDFTGTFGIHGAISGDIYNPQSTATIHVEDGTLLHKDFLLSGIKTELDFENLFQMVSAPDQQLDFQSFVFEHAEVQNGSIQYEFRDNRLIAINTAKFHALNGTFRAQSPILINTNTGEIGSAEDATAIPFSADMISLVDLFSFFKIGYAETAAKLNGKFTAKIQENGLSWEADVATPTGESGEAAFPDLDRYALLQPSNENVEFALAFFAKMQYNYLKLKLSGVPGKLHLTLTGDGRPCEPLPFKPAATPGDFTAASASDYFFAEELVVGMDIDVDVDKFN